MKFVEDNSDMLRKQVKSVVRKQAPWFVVSWRLCAARQGQTSCNSQYRETNSGFKIQGVLSHPPYSPDSASSNSQLFCP